jgi:hypothetical protein
VGSFNSARTASASATGSLTGRRRVYLIGTITDLNSGRIEIRPAFIGIRSFLEDKDLTPGKTMPGLRVYPSQIGQFREVDFSCRVSSAELKAVLEVCSDLYTSRLFARGRQMSAAWLLKGPGYPHPMTVRALGKPGDQIVRLFSEPAELLVLQHCHEITPSVVSMIEAYAHDLRNPRKYMIIDGADTSRVLKSQGLLPAASLHKPLD